MDLDQRTKKFALRIIRLVGALPKNNVAKVIGNQILRSGTSVGAHFWESRQARSNAEFISKIQGGLQELYETMYWLEIILESEILPENQLGEIMNETNELTAILIRSVKTAKQNRKKNEGS